VDEIVKIDVSQVVQELQLRDQTESEASKNTAKKSRDKQGKRLQFNDPEPSTLPQDGAMLLDDLVRQIRRFLVIDIESAYAIALWIVFTHLAPYGTVCPNLCVTSATKACGKSTALEIVRRLVPRALATSNISTAALFRTIDAYAPTMIIDEADSMFRTNEDLRTIMNAGFTRSAAQVIRIVGEDLEPRTFNVFCPKAIALIGNLPATLASRSIIIEMRRRKSDEEVERLRADRDLGFRDLHARVQRFALDHGAKIQKIDPEIPSSLSDRQADCWRELLRIADFVGGEWPQQARSAAMALSAHDASDPDDVKERLLSDLHTIVSAQPERDRWPSQTLVDRLNEIEESPWPQFNHGKGMTASNLARILRPFGIKPRTLKQEGHCVKGYYSKDFTEAFERYLPERRNPVTNADNLIFNKHLEGYGSVTVTPETRNRADFLFEEKAI
jgi:putative DNA primase/helicase